MRKLLFERLPNGQEVLTPFGEEIFQSTVAISMLFVVITLIAMFF
jgi:hypothetical protein